MYDTKPNVTAALIEAVMRYLGRNLRVSQKIEHSEQQIHGALRRIVY